MSSAAPWSGNQSWRLLRNTASDCSAPIAMPPMNAGSSAEKRPSTAAASAGTMKSV